MAGPKPQKAPGPGAGRIDNLKDKIGNQIRVGPPPPTGPKKGES